MVAMMARLPQSSRKAGSHIDGSVDRAPDITMMIAVAFILGISLLQQLQQAKQKQKRDRIMVKHCLRSLPVLWSDRPMT